MGKPIGYLITFTTYGSWLHGSNKGSVDDEHCCWGRPFAEVNTGRQVFESQQMKNPVFLMDQSMRELALSTVIEICRKRNWELYAMHARSNHIHIVINSQEEAKKMMGDIKAWLSRRLRGSFSDLGKRKLWTHHGSTKYLWNENALLKAIKYTIQGQGEPMSFYQKETGGKS